MPYYLLFMALEYPAKHGYHQPRPKTPLNQKASYIHVSLGQRGWHTIRRKWIKREQL